MSSVEAANRFVNCVMNRTRHDTVLRNLLVIILVITPFLASLFGLLLLDYKGNLEDDLIRFLSQICSTFIFYSEMLVVFFIYRRVIDHTSRDIEWRNSLIEYAGNKGCNVNNMINLNDSIKKTERTVAEKPAIFLIVLLFTSIIIFVGCPDLFNIDTNDAMNVAVVTIMALFNSFIMTCIVLTYLVRAPYVHESMQIEFTEEFAHEMEKLGVNIPVMKKTVRSRKISKRIPILIIISSVVVFILFLFSLGLFALVPMHRSYVDTNYHIMNQWDYEVELMNIIISNEGGSGVIPRKRTEVSDCG